MVRLIAITGGMGSGKSTFSALLRARGYVVVDADVLAGKALETLPVIALVKNLVGEHAYTSEHKYCRDFVRQQVFSDPSKRKALEAIVHPVVRELLQNFRNRIEESAPGAWIFYEIPLLFEVSRERDFDLSVLVTAAEDERVRRVVQSRNLSEIQARAIMATQMPEDQKAQRAGLIVENNSSVENLETEASRVLLALRAMFTPSKN
jgi:dephospho-CoA kinase